ncbi:MAG: PAS domain-containing protein, partial [Rectinema sp.]|nr:PAS domain-containing protein [Rectinema sp.]
IEEIQHLCEVHVEVFKSSLQKEKVASKVPGHPVFTMREENREGRRRLRALKRADIAWKLRAGPKEKVLEALDEMAAIIVHYTRKENQLFPFLEQKQFTGPSKVMWGKHDEIRALFKEAREKVAHDDRSAIGSLHALAGKIGRMFFMEEHILIPEALRRLSDQDWARIRLGEDAIGFAWVRPGAVYDPHLVLAGVARNSEALAQHSPSSVPGSPAPGSHLVELSTGLVPQPLLDAALRVMPIDISIVDADDKVVYYSDSPHRVFPRSPAIIGRSVQNCHPQKSVATVNKILDAFRKGEKDSARFWLDMGGRFILIEYHALRDASGSYLGTLEASQDLTEYRALQGQRRLLDWD